MKLAATEKSARLPLSAIVFALAALRPERLARLSVRRPRRRSSARQRREATEVSAESADGTRADQARRIQHPRLPHRLVAQRRRVVYPATRSSAKTNYPDFEHSYGHRKNKVRDQIVIATRLVPIEDYDDPELKKFRRRILLRLRRSLPELPIDESLLQRLLADVRVD